jgi:hypothetical protein
MLVNLKYMQNSDIHQIIDFYGFLTTERQLNASREPGKPNKIKWYQYLITEGEKMLENYKDAKAEIRSEEDVKKIEIEIEINEIERRLNEDKQKLEEELAIALFNNAIVVPGNCDILDNEHDLSGKADALYQRNKAKLLDAKTIEIVGRSFGGLNTFAFLVAISRDTTCGQEILNKITNIRLIDPLPNIGQSRIGTVQATALWTAKAFAWAYNSFSLNYAFSPSIRKYLATIAQNGCTLPNAHVDLYQANNDTVVKNTEDYNKLIKARLGEIVKSCNQHSYAGTHLSLRTVTGPYGIEVYNEDKQLLKPQVNLQQDLSDADIRSEYEPLQTPPQHNPSLLNVNNMSDDDDIADEGSFLNKTLISKPVCNLVGVADEGRSMGISTMNVRERMMK